MFFKAVQSQTQHYKKKTVSWQTQIFPEQHRANPRSRKIQNVAKKFNTDLKLTPFSF